MKTTREWVCPICKGKGEYTKDGVRYRCKCRKPVCVW